MITLMDCVRGSSLFFLTSAYSEETTKTVLNRPQIGGFVRMPHEVGHLVQTLRGVLPSNFTP
jgi:hypothetical protein